MLVKRPEMSVGEIKYTQIAKFRSQRGTHLGPVGPRWAPCGPHELCYQGRPGRGKMDCFWKAKKQRRSMINLKYPQVDDIVLIILQWLKMGNKVPFVNVSVTTTFLASIRMPGRPLQPHSYLACVTYQIWTWHSMRNHWYEDSELLEKHHNSENWLSL